MASSASPPERAVYLPPLSHSAPGDSKGARGSPAAHAQTEQLGGVAPRLDFVLHSEIDAHKNALIQEMGGSSFFRTGADISYSTGSRRRAYTNISDAISTMGGW